MENEVWKDIKGYEGLYQVSNLGRVKTLERKIYNNGIKKETLQKEKIMSNKKTNGNGYIIVSLTKNGASKNKYVHRLVAETFMGNEDNLPCINHKNEIRSDNNVNNLEYCTYKYNNNYNGKAKRAGLKLRNNKKTSKKIYQMNENDEIINEYPSISQASRELNISVQSLCECLRGKQKHCLGYKWKYVE